MKSTYKSVHVSHKCNTVLHAERHARESRLGEQAETLNSPQWNSCLIRSKAGPRIRILFCESNARSQHSSPTYSRCRGTQGEQQPPEAVRMRLLTVGYGPHMGGTKHCLISFMCPAPTSCWQTSFVCLCWKTILFWADLRYYFSKTFTDWKFWKIPLLKMLSLSKDKPLQFKLQGCKPRDLFQNLCQLK